MWFKNRVHESSEGKKKKHTLEVEKCWGSEDRWRGPGKI